uniref:Uncharacterized protein n=1 Tax=Acrobeloides nanus TaxID=290746 RepID=A0A914ESC9_9BILA
MASIGLNTLLQTLGEVIHRTIDNILRYVVPGLRQTLFNASIDWWGFEHASASRMLQMLYRVFKSMLKAPPVNQCIEKEFDEGLEQHMSRCYRPCGG